MKSPLQLLVPSAVAANLQPMIGTAPSFVHELSFCQQRWIQLPQGTITLQEVAGTDYVIWQWNIKLNTGVSFRVKAEEGGIVLLQIVEAPDDRVKIAAQTLELFPKMYLLCYIPAGTHELFMKGPLSFYIFLQPPLSFLEGLKKEVPGVAEMISHFLQQQKKLYRLPPLPILQDSWMRLKKIDVPTLNDGIPDLKLRSYIIDVLHDFGKAAKQKPSSQLVFYSSKQKAIIVKEYLDKQVLDPSLPALSELAKQFYTEPRALTSAFRQLTGNSIPQYISAARLATAHAYIKETNLPVMEIGFRCGFNDISHFIRSYKRRYGLTPGRMRKKQE